MQTTGTVGTSMAQSEQRQSRKAGEAWGQQRQNMHGAGHSLTN